MTLFAKGVKHCVGYIILLSILATVCYSCPEGYYGPTCNLLRSCKQLSPPQNGAIITCNTTYLSPCVMRCNEGYRPIGSLERQCIVGSSDIMIWTGVPLLCVVIQCPLLPPVKAATVYPAQCTGPGVFNTVCSYICADGYHVNNNPTQQSTTLVCKIDGSWSEQPPVCNDNEPPVISCPTDIVQNDLTVIETRVAWDTPYATDNSGDQPILSSSRQSGDLFSVPGSYEIVYTAEDGSGNKATCSFRITLEKKTCPLYPPPANGALACGDTGADPYCMAMCRRGFDFNALVAFFYFCNSGSWQTISFYPISFPWPNCTASSGNPQMGAFPEFYYSDANDPSVVDTEIKNNFITFFTKLNLQCLQGPCLTEESITVYLG